MDFELLLLFLFFFSKQFKNCADSREASKGLGFGDDGSKMREDISEKYTSGEDVSVTVFPKCQRALLRNDTTAGELTQFLEMNPQRPWANPKDPQLHTAVEILTVPMQQVSSEDL